MWSYAPRVGLAWDVFGDGKTAIRASTGVFYNFVNRNTYGFSGGALVSRNRTIPNSTLNELASAVAAGNFVESPQGTRIPPGFGLEQSLHGNQLPQGELEPERNYHVNIAFQRDIGFNTVAEVAYVSNIGRKQARSKTINNIEPYAYANPNNLFNKEAIAENFLRRDYPGVGSISYLTTDDDILNYNAMQVSVQRRLTKGLQMGLAYTLSKSEGMQGWDYMTEELYGKQGLRDRYYGPPAGNPVGVQDGRQDRRHVVVVNYSYMIPNPTPNVTILKHVLRDWEASGVSTFMTGSNVNPGCGEDLSGVANNDPSLSGVGSRCELVPGQDINDTSGNPVDPTITHDAFRPHFNLAAFRRPLPANGVRATSATRRMASAPSPGLAELGLHAGASHSGEHRPGRQRPRAGAVLQRVQHGAVPAPRGQLHVRPHRATRRGTPTPPRANTTRRSTRSTSGSRSAWTTDSDTHTGCPRTVRASGALRVVRSVEQSPSFHGPQIANVIPSDPAAGGLAPAVSP